MKKPEIKYESFKGWQKYTWTEYAACTNFEGKRLSFKANMALCYWVTLGIENLYYGIDFERARLAFETETTDDGEII